MINMTQGEDMQGLIDQQFFLLCILSDGRHSTKKFYIQKLTRGFNTTLLHGCDTKSMVNSSSMPQEKYLNDNWIDSPLNFALSMLLLN